MTEADRRQVEMIRAYLGLSEQARAALDEDARLEHRERAAYRQVATARKVDRLGRPAYWLFGRRRITYAELQQQLSRIEGASA